MVPPETNGTGNYLVLWWKGIVLGDLYLEPDEQISAAAYRRQVAGAILPVVESYAGRADFDREHFFSNRKNEDWAEKLEKIFASPEAGKIPDRVPVSVIVCTYDRPFSLAKCLAGLEKMTCLPEEIIVVDNAPDNDRTREVVARFPGVRYVAEPKKGLSNARNRGILHSSCQIVAFTDDDVLVHPLWICRIWEAFSDESVAAVTGLVIARSLKTEAQLIFEKHWTFNMGYLTRDFDPNYLYSAEAPRVWEIGAGANMAFRKSVFEQVGPFHELLGAGAAGCSEDSEMWFRILAAGNIIRYDPKPIVFHEHRTSIKDLKKQIFNYMRGFTAAVLWQQRQRSEFRYKRLLFILYPIYYTGLLVKSLLRRRDRNRTVWVEIKGILSGLHYFYKNFRPAAAAKDRRPAKG